MCFVLKGILFRDCNMPKDPYGMVLGTVADYPHTVVLMPFQQNKCCSLKTFPPPLEHGRTLSGRAPGWPRTGPGLIFPSISR